MEYSEVGKKIDGFFSTQEEKDLAYDYLELFSTLYYLNKGPVISLNLLMLLFICLLFVIPGSPLLSSFIGIFLSLSLLLSLCFNLWLFFQIYKIKIVRAIMWRRNGSFLEERVFQGLLVLLPEVSQIIKESELEAFF